MSDEPVEQFVVPGPGEPLLSWGVESDWRIKFKFKMLVEQTHAEIAVQKLVDGGDTTVDDIATIGHLNFAAFVSGFEPPAALWRGTAKLDPRILEWLRNEDR